MLTDAGRLYMLKVLTGQIAAETIRMGLYGGTPTWARTTVLADVGELTASGYARQNTSGWGAPVTLGTGNGSTVASQVVFSNTSAGAVVANGFFYVTGTSNVFLGGDAFAAPLTIPATIGTLSVFPELQDTTA